MAFSGTLIILAIIAVACIGAVLVGGIVVGVYMSSQRDGDNQ